MPWQTSRTYPISLSTPSVPDWSARLSWWPVGAFELTRALSHGRAAAVAAIAKTLGLLDLFGPAYTERDIAYALVLVGVLHARPKLGTTK